MISLLQVLITLIDVVVVTEWFGSQVVLWEAAHISKELSFQPGSACPCA